LDLLADVLLNPVFNPPDIQRKIQEVVAGIKRDQDDPGTVSYQAFLALIYGQNPFGGRSKAPRPRCRPSPGRSGALPRGLLPS
jgi:hypothetical protein